MMCEQNTRERMDPGLNDLRKRLSSTDVFEVLSARRVGPNELERIMHLVPYPKDIDVKNPLPEWKRLPLCSKIPFVKAPKDFVVVTRGKLGETVRRQGDTFDLSDPLNYNLRIDYDPIHDKHLRHYFFCPGNKKLLDDMGILTKDNAVKCDLKDYNAYRRYVYNVHKNSVLNALRETEETKLDMATARDFLQDALETRQMQFRKEEIEKHAIRRAAQRRVFGICEKLLCENRMKRFDDIQEKKAKQKERDELRLLVSQKKFQESLENYRIKSHDVAWKRNIRAQKKWRKVYEAEANRKSINAEIERIKRLLEVIESWIRKDVQQIATRERDTKIWNAYKHYSEQRKSARERNFKSIHQRNTARLQEIKNCGPTPKEELDRLKHCNYVGDVLAGFRKLKPEMKRAKPVISIISQTMKKAAESGDRKSKDYLGTNLMNSRTTSAVSENIMGCIYRRALTMYIKNAVFRYLPILITELKHVVAIFEEDLSRKELEVDKIRRLVKSYVGQRKSSMFETPNAYTSFGFIGKIKDKILKISNKNICRCDSDSDAQSDSSKRKISFNNVPISMVKEQKKDRKVIFTMEPETEEERKAEKKESRNEDQIVPKVSQSSPKGKLPPTKLKEHKLKTKARQVRLVSILKGCPMYRDNEGGSKDDFCCLGPLHETCSCDDSVCHCVKEVNTVKFTEKEASSVKSPEPKDLDEGRKESKGIYFAEKPTIHYVPQLDWSTSLPDELSVFFPVDSKKQVDPPADTGKSTRKLLDKEDPSVMFSLEPSEVSEEKKRKSSKDEVSFLRDIGLSSSDRCSSTNLASKCNIDTIQSEYVELQQRESHKGYKRVTLSNRKSTAENIIGRLLSSYQEKFLQAKSGRKSCPKSETPLCTNVSPEDSFSNYSEKSGDILSIENGSSNVEPNPIGLAQTEDLNELDGHSRQKNTRKTELNGNDKFNKKRFSNPTFVELEGSSMSKMNYLEDLNGKNKLDSGRNNILVLKNTRNINSMNSGFNRIALSNSDKQFFHIKNGQFLNNTKNIPKAFKYLNENKCELYGVKNVEGDARSHKNEIQESYNYCDDMSWKMRIQKKRDSSNYRKCIARKNLNPKNSDINDTIENVSHALNQQFVISQRNDDLGSMGTTSAVIGDYSQNILSTSNVIDEGGQNSRSQVTPDQLSQNTNKDPTEVITGTYSSGDKPRGVNIKKEINNFRCHLKVKRPSKDRKVFSYYPKGIAEPQCGNLFNLKQIFEPSYKPLYSPDVARCTSEVPELKSILKKTTYSPAENCSLVPKYLSHYKFRSVDDLKHFIMLRSFLSAGEALAASKLDEKYIKSSESDNTLVGSASSKTRKKKKEGNLEVLKKYSQEIIPAGNETYKKLLGHVHIPGKDIQSLAVDIQDLSPEVSENAGGSGMSIGTGDAFVKYPKPSSSVTKLVAEAIPEINQVYSEFFIRGDNISKGECIAKRLRSVKQSAALQRRGRSKLRFKTPHDVIMASMEISGGISGRKSGNFSENKNNFSLSHRKRSRSPSPEYDSKIHMRDESNPEAFQETGPGDSTSSSSIGLSVPICRKFNILTNKSKPKETVLCEICGVCTHNTTTNNLNESSITDILKCGQCGRCIHDLQTPPSCENNGLTINSVDLIKSRKKESEGQLKSGNNMGDSQIRFLNSDEIKKYFFEKRKKAVEAKADMRGVFGHDFDPNKFVFFVDDTNEYICWDEVLTRRYPLRPFPWDEIKLERLKKRKLPVRDLKSYTHPEIIFQRKAAKGYENWESTRKEKLGEGHAELKLNWVPPKYANLFSTTHKPANRPERKFNSIKSRRPTPMPSATDLVTRVLEESRGNLYEAKEKLKREESLFSVMKTKIDSTVRVLINVITVMCIIKMKRGYPNLTKMCSKKTKMYYFVPLNSDRFFARKLVRGLSEFLITHGVKDMHYATLEPMVDILLKYIVDPDKYPLIFPERGDEILDDSDYSDIDAKQEVKEEKTDVEDVQQISDEEDEDN